jgi:hypothetical protein
MAALACSSFDGASDVAPAPGPAAATSSTTSLSATPGEDWSCLQNAVSARPVPALGATPFAYRLQLLDLATQRVAAGLAARACGLADVECARPVAGPVLTDEEGWLELPLFEGFTGYLEVWAPGVQSVLLHIAEPLTRDQVPDYPYLVLSIDTVVALGRGLGVELEPTQGMIAIRVFDCQRLLAPGIVFSTPGTGLAYYFVGGLPSVMADETGADGMGGFLNVPTGLAQLEATTPQGASIRGPRSMVIRPGWMSSAFVFARDSQ